MTADRYLQILPTWALLAATFVVALVMPVQGAKPQPHHRDYVAEGRAIVKAEIAREANGQHCGPVVRITAAFPQRVLVSRVTGGLVSTAVESMTYDEAVKASMAGRVTIRCAIL